jgi:superfamily II helicase
MGIFKSKKVCAICKKDLDEKNDNIIKINNSECCEKCAFEYLNHQMNPSTKKKIINSVILNGQDYDKVIAEGEINGFSAFANQHWHHYTQSLIHIMILDTLVNIESKLDNLTNNNNEN